MVKQLNGHLSNAPFHIFISQFTLTLTHCIHPR